MKGAIFSLSGLEIGRNAFCRSWTFVVSESSKNCRDARGGWGRVEGASPSPPTTWASFQLHNFWLLNDDLVVTWWSWWRTRWPWCSSQQCRWTVARWKRGEGRWRWAKWSDWKLKAISRWTRCPGSTERSRGKLLKSCSRHALMDCFWQVLDTRAWRWILAMIKKDTYYIVKFCLRWESPPTSLVITLFVFALSPGLSIIGSSSRFDMCVMCLME